MRSLQERLQDIDKYGKHQTKSFHDQVVSAREQLKMGAQAVRGMMQGSPADQMLTAIGWPNPNPPPTPQENLHSALMDMFGVGEIKVFHGSPHKFPKFKMNPDTAGTGAGGQSFGYGLYFTESEAIARGYAKQRRLWGMRHLIDDVPIREIPHPINSKKVLSRQDIEANQIKEIASWMRTYDVKYEAHLPDRLKPLNKKLKDSGRIKEVGGGQIYNVTLHKGKTPDQYNYLEWKPVVPKKQQEQILKQAEKEFHPNFAKDLRDKFEAPRQIWNGGILYKILSMSIGSDEAASAFLKRAGIDGIKYPSGTLSRIKDSDIFNYVVFDEADIVIEKTFDDMVKKARKK